MGRLGNAVSAFLTNKLAVSESTEFQNAKEQLRIAAMQRLTRQLSQRPAVMESVMPGVLVDDDSSPFFDPYSYQTADAIDEGTFREMQRRCYVLDTTDPLCSGWRLLMRNHIVGDNFQMHSRDHDPATQEVWDEQAENMAGDLPGVVPYPFAMFAQDLVDQALRYGEDFQREYRKKFSGELFYRIMEPIWIYNPGKQWPWPTKQWTNQSLAIFGIQTDPYDYERRLAYYWDQNRNGRMVEVTGDIPFETEPPVIHTRINASRNMKRGRPWLLPVLKPMIQLNKVIQARLDMHLLRVCVAYWDELPENPDPKLLEWLQKENTIDDEGVNDGRLYNNEHGSVGTLHGLKRTYANPNLEAGDAYNDIKVHIMRMAKALGLSFETAWGDNSQSTMASSRESVSTELITFKTWQAKFGVTFSQLGARRIQSAIEAGRLSPMSYEKTQKMTGGTPDSPAVNIINGEERVPRNTGFDCEYPELRIRDVKALTDALLGQLAADIIDPREAQVQLGYDADSMNRRIMLWKQEHPKPLEDLESMLAGSKNGNGSNGTGGNGRSDSKAMYRRMGTQS